LGCGWLLFDVAIGGKRQFLAPLAATISSIVHEIFAINLVEAVLHDTVSSILAPAFFSSRAPSIAAIS
jgi:hypothetical protein